MRCLFLLISFGCMGALSHAQTADELIAKNIEARGGLERIKAIKTMRVIGKIKGFGGRVMAMGEENAAIQAYDGTTGWQVEPFGGKKDPELMGEDSLRDLLLDADFDGPLVDYKEKGSTVEYLGHDLVDGDDALRLKVMLKNGDIIYDYLDPDTFIEIRREIQQFIRGSVREREESFGSYKPVAGVMFPFAIATGSRNVPDAQTTAVQKIEVNVNIDPADFALPESLRTEEKKSGLVGIH